MKTLLFIILSLPLVLYSQDTTRLPTPIARLVIRDLVDYDLCKNLLKLSNEQVSLLEKKVVAKDSVISVFGLKQTNYLQQIEAEKSKAVIWQQQYSEVNSLYKKERILRNLERTALLAIVGSLTYLYITK